jgi:hypothetical protein
MQLFICMQKIDFKKLETILNLFLSLSLSLTVLRITQLG